MNLPPIPNTPMPDWSRSGQIPIVECGEDLHPTSLAPSITTYPAYYKMGVPYAVPECFIRLSAYRRLLQAAKHLPSGVQMVVMDAWRPVAVQAHLFQALTGLMAEMDPDQSESDRYAQARDLIAPPSDSPDAPSAHLTGGAVDVILVDANGLPLDMGTQFDEASPRSATAYFELIQDPTNDEKSVQNNRRLLYQVMTQVGFVNLPSEWWHFAYGDQLWAWYSDSAYAFYGPSEPATLESQWRAQLGHNR